MLIYGYRFLKIEKLSSSHVYSFIYYPFIPSIFDLVYFKLSFNAYKKAGET